MDGVHDEHDEGLPEYARICSVRKSGRTAIKPSSKSKSAHLVIGSSDNCTVVKHIRSKAPSTMVVTLDATERGRVNRTGEKFTHAVNFTLAGMA